MTDIFEFYLFSLSRHRNDRQQWQCYGQHGRGFAIGLARSLFQANQTNLSERANENIFVGRVIYGDVPTEQRHRRAIECAADITSRVAQASPFLVPKLKPSNYILRMAQDVIASQLIWNCLTAKHMNYANEREVRYVIMNEREKFDADRKSLNGRHYIEAPCELKIPGTIMEVLVGPLAPAGAEEMIDEFLKAQGYPDDILIH